MSDQHQNFDNTPIVNSFLTTIEEHPTPIEHIRPPTESLSRHLNQWYEGKLATDIAEAKILQAKKQKQLLKQNRIKQLEQEFELQRIKKQKEIEQKLANIEKNKNKNLNHIQQKFHKISIRHHKIIVKIQDQNLKQLQKNYDSRKAYEIDSPKHFNKHMNISQQSNRQQRNKFLKRQNTKTVQQQDIRVRINTIDSRLQKAKTMYRQRQSQTVNKARNHNMYDLNHAQSRAKQQFDQYLKIYATKIVNKMESAQFQKNKIEKQLQKKNEQKHKFYNEKLKKIQNNLTQLQEQQQQKFQQLSKKLQKTNTQDKGDKTNRETLYQKKFLDNLQHLQREKLQRANQIMQKHQQITLKNRLYKQKRQTLYRNFKIEAL